MAAALALALATPFALATGSVSGEETETACAPGNVPLGLVCAEGTITGRVACTLDAASYAECKADSTWNVGGRSPVGLDGRMERGASSQISFCPPGDFCRSFGVGFLVVGCAWEALSDGCSREDQYALATGRWRLDAGECLEATLGTAAWVYAWRDPSPEALVAVASPYHEVTDSVCA